MKKIIILTLISLLLLSTIGYVTSKPINPYESNDESHLYENDYVNIEQDIENQDINADINANPKPIHSRSLADTPWPMFRQNQYHTGLSSYNTSNNQGKYIWSVTTGDYFFSSPAIGLDGTIYVGSYDNKLHAINPNGTKKWSFITNWDVASSPAIGADGTIYVGSNDNNLYAINPDGTKKWDFSTSNDVMSSPVIGIDGIIYVGSYDYNLYAIYPNGGKKWNCSVNGQIFSSPALDTDGTIYVGSRNNNVYAIDSNGIIKWNYTTGNEIWSSPTIDSNHIVYIGSHDHRLYAIYPNGTKKWDFLTGDVIYSSPAIGNDGTIYIGSDDNKLYAIYPNGTKKWDFATNNDIYSSPSIGSDGTIYIGSEDDKIYAINPNGTEKWSYTTTNRIRSSPSIDSDGTIYVSSEDDKIYAIGKLIHLLNYNVTPSIGTTDTFFNYSINYIHKKDKIPVSVKVCIDNINYSMYEVDNTDTYYFDGKDYFLNISNLDIGMHTYQFWISDGINIESTEIFYNPLVINTQPEIITPNNLTAIEDNYYEVDYEYEDIDLDNVGQIGTWNYLTNATWLYFNPSTAMLYGTPTNDDVGSYWVNISINDTRDMDFTYFTLTVMNVNDNPLIETTDFEITYEDELYEVDYSASDVDSPILNQIWSLSSNATSWLDIDSITGVISGIPTNDEVGEYWVNVTVDDGDSGLAFTNFTLIVLNVNDPPAIITEDVLEAPINKLYEVDYNATDIDSPQSKLKWSLFTNATTWLDIDYNTGVLSGTPGISDVGWYNVNVTVSDQNGGQVWREFILTVTPQEEPEPDNDPPEITTIDKVSTTAGCSYKVIYEAIDDKTPLESLIWSYNSNASWLSFNKVTRVLSGNPILSDVGWYWVNVTVFDGEGKFDTHNFTVTVWATANEPPEILTEDDINAVVDELYSVDYDASDDRTPVNKLQWSLETNTSDWLDIDPKTGVLSGTPKVDNLGSYWVRVSVYDNEDGWDFTNFTLYVTTEPITDFKPELSNPSVTPTSGDTKTFFTFSVDYNHPEDDPPDSIQVVIDDYTFYDLIYNASSDSYEYCTKLAEGEHSYYFTATLGESTVSTEVNTIRVNWAPEPPPPENGDGDGDEDNTMLYAIIGIIVIIIVVLILLFILLKRKKGVKEEPMIEEVQPPPPEEVPSEVPPEQVPTPESPIPEQPPVSEVPTEQVLAPEIPPEQPQVPTEQPPTPEVTPQVPQPSKSPRIFEGEGNMRSLLPKPQVEQAPEPEPMPQVEEQPALQPQGEPQPEGQAPVPKVKTQPIIKEKNG